jgi:uncharacterized RDD family membrane protein YckC
MPPILPVAGPLSRLAAGCYDLLILTGVLVSTSFVVIAARGGIAVPVGNPVFQGFLAAQVAAYFIGFWARGGQTPGMRAWRLRVQTVDGNTPSPAVAAVRFGAALLAAAPAGLGFLWMLVDADNRTWHDRLSGTRIVRLSAKPPQ